MTRVTWAVWLGLLAGCSAAAAEPIADPRYDDGSLGALAFPVSEGTPGARAHFMRGLLALHSFWYDEATREFQAAIDADSTMSMAYWGAAMSQCKLLWGDDDVDAARKLLNRIPEPDRLPEREMAWVLAAVELLKASDVRTSRKQFAAAMERLYTKYPDDESATFLAAALLASAHPEDPDYLVLRLRAGALAMGVFAHNPKHPGAAHYLIHAYDVPELAPLALPYAYAYAKIAPAAFHARHMPAHIFARLGMWKEAIASCQAAWDASVAATKRDKLTADHDDFHSLNWLIEMPFELGRRKDADAAMVVFAKAVRGGLGRQARTAYANQVASYLTRTGEWSRVDELLAPLQAPAVETGGPAGRSGGAASHCGPAADSSPRVLVERLAVIDARARGAAMQRDLPKTQRLMADMDLDRQKMRPFLEATLPKEVLARLEAAHARHRAALLARASGDDRGLLKILRDSVNDETTLTGGESNPNGYLAHEDIGETLMRLGESKAALAEFEQALLQHPGRARALLGAARAAAHAGDAETARGRYQQLLQQWSTADAGTPGLAEARAAAVGH